MEAWATVVIVLVSNAIIGAVSVLTVRKQLKHSVELFKMQQEVQEEKEKRERRREVRDEPLVKLRDELAKMAVKLSASIDLATQVTDEVSKESDKVIEDLDKAVKEWDEYIKSGEFERTLHMQYDYNLKMEAHGIFWDYQSAYKGIREVWRGGRKKEDEAISEAIDVVKRNAVKVSEIQLKIIKQREEL
jgi:uncharacterized membrane-anchored protein YhcB (DUF1043 family)